MNDLAPDLITRQFEQAALVKRLPNVTVPKLQAWLHRGHLQIGEQSPGSGHRRKWSALEAIEVATLGVLTQMRMPVRFVREIADRFRERADELVSDPEKTLTGGPVLYVIPAEGDEWLTETDARIADRALQVALANPPIYTTIMVDNFIKSTIKTLFDVDDDGAWQVLANSGPQSSKQADKERRRGTGIPS